MSRYERSRDKYDRQMVKRLKELADAESDAAFDNAEAMMAWLDGSHPETHQVVPIEPTQEMIDAGLRATAAFLDIKGSALTINREKMRLRYRAMLAAAPAPPPPESSTNEQSEKP